MLKNLVSFIAKPLVEGAIGVLKDEAYGLVDQIPSPVIKTVFLDETCSSVVFRYLRRNFRMINFGRTFVGMANTTLEAEDVTVQTSLPYTKLWSRAYFLYKGVPIRIEGNGSQILLKFARYSIDYKQLIKEAFSEHETHNRGGLIHGRLDRYTVTSIMGDSGSSDGYRGGAGAHPQPPSRLPRALSSSRSISSLESWDDDSAEGNGMGCIQQILHGVDVPLFKADQVSATGTPSDPFKYLYYDEDVLDFVKNLDIWSTRESYFQARGIPWRRGVLLHGPGGTGKSSLAKSMAQRLGLPVYQFFLSTLTDREFLSAWQDMDMPCMALFEDFDTVFHLRENVTAHKTLSFDCVLNAISGVSTRNGILLVVTSNNPGLIDPAMGVISTDAHGKVSTRPGRLDVHLHIGSMSADNRMLMAKNILRDWPTVWEEIVAKGEGMVPAQFQELCTQTAFEKIREDEDE